jgi:hypothetical protein
MQSAPGNPLPKERRYTGIAHAFRVVIKEEGVRGLYKGFFANFVKTWPTIAIMFNVNDAVLQGLNRRGW